MSICMLWELMSNRMATAPYLYTLPFESELMWNISAVVVGLPPEERHKRDWTDLRCHLFTSWEKINTSYDFMDDQKLEPWTLNKYLESAKGLVNDIPHWAFTMKLDTVLKMGTRQIGPGAPLQESRRDMELRHTCHSQHRDIYIGKSNTGGYIVVRAVLSRSQMLVEPTTDTTVQCNMKHKKIMYRYLYVPFCT